MAKFEEGDFYWGERGYRVFTEQYLLKRGYCCLSACRHCPYGYDDKIQNISRIKKAEAEKLKK